MGRDERGAKLRAEEHHRDGVVWQATAASEMLGVTGEVRTAQVHRLFAHRCGHEPAHALGERGVDRAIERRQLRLTPARSRPGSARFRIPDHASIEQPELGIGAGRRM